MATIKEIHVPDIGGASNVEVIEVAVKEGDTVQPETTLITLESDKATMDIPAPFAGTVKKLQIKRGDKVSQGSLILMLEVAEQTSDKSAATKVEESKERKIEKELPPITATSTKAEAVKDVQVPDIGGASNVEIIAVNVKPGDQLSVEDTLITLESDKATMDIPAPFAGVVKTVKVKQGDKVSQGNLILTMEAADAASEDDAAKSALPETKAETAVEVNKPISEKVEHVSTTKENNIIHASPIVRRVAREFGVDLSHVKGSGEKQRILKEDVQAFVKSQLEKARSGNGFNLPAAPTIDFSKFGETHTQALSRIKKLSGANLLRNWVSIPHVTQFDEADITELEEFRKAQKAELEKQGIKLTPLVFIMKAVVASLKVFPTFNASLDSSGENLILKKYFHIGVAVDTPDGLVVPVMRNVDQKSLSQLARELAEISAKAREKKLTGNDMQGGCFTISSLGGIGGTAFTPIINAPEVAILGVSKSSIKPIYQHEQFVPRLMLPLSLSYDHRVIDGADAARFITHLAAGLADIRRLLF